MDHRNSDDEDRLGSPRGGLEAPVVFEDSDGWRDGASRSATAMAARPGPTARDGHPQLEPEREMALLVWTALAAGMALRVIHYLSGRSLWLDEARLALNIAGRGYAGLLQPLDYDQAAPPLFLWGEKLATQLFGVNELALRAIPLAAGIAAMFLFVPIARRLLPGWAGALAIASACVAPTLVFYSAELKPYMVDVAIGLLLVRGTIAWREEPAGWLARHFPLIGALSVWASLPAAFVLPAAAGAMALSERRDPRAAGDRLRVVVAGWGLSASLAYFVLYRPGGQNAYLRAFWHNSFLALWDHDRLGRLAAAAQDVLWGLTIGYYRPPIEAAPLPPLLYRLMGDAVTALALVMTVGIVASLRRWRLWESVLVLGPCVVLIAASAASLYPLSLRLVLFIAPALYLTLFTGADRFLAELPAWARRRVGAVCAGGWLTAQLVTSAAYVVRAEKLEAVRPLAQVFERMHRPAESIYVSTGALPAWVFYTTDWSRPNQGRLARFAALGSSDGIAFENAAARGPRLSSEGSRLRFGAVSWIEVIGTASGNQERPATPARPHMDRGWFENELVRIRTEGCGRTVWVLSSHPAPPDLLLLSGLPGAGGRATFSQGRTADRAILARYEFARTTTDCSRVGA
jgi:dolichyl-phosphate-mannose-protein mannosyltransferase